MDRRRPGDPPLFYEVHVFVCCNRRPDGHRRGSCAAKGSEALRDYLKARVKELGLRGVRVNMAGCLDRCEFGPSVVIYPEGVWYRLRTREEAEAVLQEHILRGGRVPGLMLTERDVVPKQGKPDSPVAARSVSAAEGGQG